MKLSELKTEITSILRERSTYALGTQEYTNKKLTPTDILDLANVFIETPHTKFGKKDGEVVTSMKDLLSLLGKRLDAKVNGQWGKRDTFKVVKGSKPAILHQILKNNLLDKKEYIDLYKKLEDKLNLFLPKFQNNDLANRQTPTGAAKAAAHRDMKGEFGESVVTEDLLKNVITEKKLSFSQLKKGDVLIGKFPPYKEMEVLSTDSKSAKVKTSKQKNEFDIFSLNNYKLKESVNEAKFKSPDYIISTTPASSLPQQRLGHADVMIGLKMAEKLKNYTLHVRHYKLVHVDGKVALKLTPEGKTAVRVRTEDDPKYLQLIQKTVNDVVADYVSKLKESVNEGAGTLTIEKRKDGKYYWQYKFKSGKTEDWPAGFNTKADAQKDFMYRSKYIKESVNEVKLQKGKTYGGSNEY